MSVDKSWDRGAVLLRVSALHATLNPCSRQRETRAAPPTLVYGHLELTICQAYLLHMRCLTRISHPFCNVTLFCTFLTVVGKMRYLTEFPQISIEGFFRC
ncbi:hypothetical protein Y032_0015g2541 [Ancylostoma ceylanicum]|uniref:Uncharacterized protein n=1 Tax=Ancylostoma ceylanicum TaxID=53326 RepID=A0A016V897_9BILA|nr:hypothetical protein Y032_0015g2541 [Ancylostoma ceylanicum]